MVPARSHAAREKFEAVRALVRQMISEGFDLDANARLSIIEDDLAATGTYRQTFDELQYSSRVAWRNSARCIGRLLWRSLKVVDARAAATPAEVFNACVNHLRNSTSGGRIIPMITVFAPADERGDGPRIWNDQLIRYAGYGRPDGSVLGDPEQVAFTNQAIRLGWVPPSSPSPFDLLPLIVQMPGQLPEWFELPRDAVLEVPMRHPQLAWFEELGLKWHALPAVSRMALVTGGLKYTAAPFSGFYMGTEIASRNFGDEGRYNLLPVIADRLGIDRQSSWSLWKDRALVELNAAVLFSFSQAGVTIINHHSASEQFMNHLDIEEAASRAVPGDWSWLVPPMSSSACPVFHRSYEPSEPLPNYVHQECPWRFG
jgi:nitric-oxide synthase